MKHKRCYFDLGRLQGLQSNQSATRHHEREGIMQQYRSCLWVVTKHALQDENLEANQEETLLDLVETVRYIEEEDS
jgi:hypothetical protein